MSDCKRCQMPISDLGYIDAKFEDYHLNYDQCITALRAKVAELEKGRADGLKNYSMIEDLLHDLVNNSKWKEWGNPDERKQFVLSWNAALDEMFNMHRMVKNAESRATASEKKLKILESLGFEFIKDVDGHLALRGHGVIYKQDQSDFISNGAKG